MTKARDIATGGIDNSITASKLDVSGNGTAGQLLKSDGDGSFTWVDSPEPFQATTVSGTTHTLDLSSANYFNGGTTTGNTTLAFSNVPTAKTWSYDITMGQTIGGGVGNIFTTNNGTTSKNIQSTDNILLGVAFKPDGTKMFTLGSQNDRIYGWSLSTAWDVSTATLDGYASTINTYPYANLFIDTTGTHLTTGDASNGDAAIKKYTFSTPWDISTLSYTATNAAAALYSVYRMTAKNDGTAYFALDSSQDGAQINYIREFPLSTAWNVTTYGTSTNHEIKAFSGSHGLTDTSAISNFNFRLDGTVFYIHEYVSASNSNILYGWSLSTAWDLSSTMTYLGSTNVTSITSGTFSTLWDGASSDNYKYVCLSENTNDTITVVDVETNTPHTLTYPASVQNPTDIISTMEYQDKYKLEFITTDGGTTVWKTGHNKYQDN